MNLPNVTMGRPPFGVGNLLPKEHACFPTPEERTALEKIRAQAKIRHERERKAASRAGRDYPDSPYECSWAYELKFIRESRASIR